MLYSYKRRNSQALYVERNLRSFRATIVAVEKYFTTCMCICILSFPACNGHVPYYHLLPALLYNNFPHCLKKGTIFEKNLLNIKYMFRVSLKSLSEIFSILRRIDRDVIKKSILVFM
jgi:hypothetical protein